jgi:hypothetical protein
MATEVVFLRIFEVALMILEFTPCGSGLPDGRFSNQNPNLGKFWRVLLWKMLVNFMGISSFCGHLVYFVSVWYTLWPFGIIYGYLVYFSRFGILYQEKSGNSDAA